MFLRRRLNEILGFRLIINRSIIERHVVFFIVPVIHVTSFLPFFFFLFKIPFKGCTVHWVWVESLGHQIIVDILQGRLIIVHVILKIDHVVVIAREILVLREIGIICIQSILPTLASQNSQIVSLRIFTRQQTP